MSIPYWGSRVELMEVIAMARGGRIHAETTEFPLGEAVAVYDKLKAGQITGRAVLNAAIGAASRSARVCRRPIPWLSIRGNREE
jgi:hypothetical protein